MATDIAARHFVSDKCASLLFGIGLLMNGEEGKMEKPAGCPWEKGYLQVYTGDGKGKTTAALGLALRAAGAGARVYIAQFVKGMYYAELKALERFSDLIVIERFGRECFIRNKPDAEDIALARRGLARAGEIIASGEHPLVILDEASIAIYFELFSIADLLEIVRSRPAWVEVVVTGRRAPEELLAVADLVTEMREIKHYYQAGVAAREGIEK
jgi:cob(I)alamin adenosyltransferase